MELTKDRLLEIKQDAVQERDKYLNMIQQANGAIAMIEHLIQQLDAPEPVEPEESDGLATV